MAIGSPNVTSRVAAMMAAGMVVLCGCPTTRQTRTVEKSGFLGDYSQLREGGQGEAQLVYIKPGLYEGEYFPKDVYNYATESADFPHETTADQFFSESQFESYHALGFEIMDSVLTQAAQNIAHVKDPARRSANKLCDLVSALDRAALAGEEKRPRASDILKLLDTDDLAQMRTILAPSKA